VGVTSKPNGACLAIDDGGGDGEKWVVVIARLRAPTLDYEFAMAIEDVFATARMFEPPAS
jgi:hypothetical protein